MTRAGKLGARDVDDRAAVLRRRREPVDDRQIDVGVGRPVLVDDHAVAVDQVHRRADAADAHRAPFVDRDLDGGRQHAADRRALDPRRRQQLLLPVVEAHGENVLAAQTVDQREHLAGGQPFVAAHHHVADLERRRRGQQRDAAVGGVTEHHHEDQQLQRKPGVPRSGAALPRRFHVRALETFVGRDAGLAEAVAKQAGHHEPSFAA